MQIRNDPVTNRARARLPIPCDALFCSDFGAHRMEPPPRAVYISLTRNRIPISFTTMRARAVVSE
jgi:hypothetical protein